MDGVGGQACTHWSQPNSEIFFQGLAKGRSLAALAPGAPQPGKHMQVLGMHAYLVLKNGFIHVCMPFVIHPAHDHDETLSAFHCQARPFLDQQECLGNRLQRSRDAGKCKSKVTHIALQCVLCPNDPLQEPSEDRVECEREEQSRCRAALPYPVFDERRACRTSCFC